MIGFVCTGLFIGSDIKSGKNQDGTEYNKQVVAVAIGMESVQIYMKDIDMGIGKLALGDLVSISCRPYAGRKGIGFSDGVMLSNE